MRVLITGGAGFVGSHLADACLLRGDQVFVIDDLSTGSIDNIEYLKRHPYFHYTIDRVQNERVTAELVDRVDMVYHLAAEVGVRRVIDSPISTIENNVQATEVVFAAAAKKGKRVLFTSTSEATTASRGSSASAPTFPTARTATSSWARRPRDAGATPAPRRSTSSSPSRTTTSGRCR